MREARDVRSFAPIHGARVPVTDQLIRLHLDRSLRHRCAMLDLREVRVLSAPLLELLVVWLNLMNCEGIPENPVKTLVPTPLVPLVCGSFGDSVDEHPWEMII